MYGFRFNFIAGLLIGALLALAAPLAASDLLSFLLPAPAGASASSESISAIRETIAPQSVNRAGKSDRWRQSERATGDAPRARPVIPLGCDSAFSPLSKGADANYSSRCLADNSLAPAARIRANRLAQL